MNGSLVESIVALEQALPKLKPSDRNFAESLVNGPWGFKKRGKLSEKQWAWVEKLIARANGSAEAKPVEQGVGSLEKLMALFATAKASLKWPKLHLEVDGLPVVIAIAGPKSSRHGWLRITDGGAFGVGRFYGWVSPEGGFQPSGSLSAQETDKIARLLRHMSHAPAETAKTYGRLTGNCCFCRRELSDEKSTAAGFGPVCAQKWGLFAEWKSAAAVLS